MSAFTFTAPIVTEEEERLERQALTTKERERLYAEIHGTETIVEPHTEEISQKLQALHDCLEHQIPLAKKQDYVTAKETVPYLVELESPALRFLQACQYNPTVAAHRLCLYWTTRCQIFGPKLAYHPMTTTTLTTTSTTLSGALVQDLEYLRKAMILVLPNDDHGRAVIFVDQIRCSREVAPRHAILTSFWYALQCISEQQASSRGLVVISNYRGYDLYKHFDRILFKKQMWCLHCMPLTLKAVHVCTGSGASVTRDLVLPVLKHVAGKDYRLRLQLHAGSTSEILEIFQEFGMGQDHVKVIFGGYGGNQPLLQEWLQQRQLIEKDRYDFLEKQKEQQEAEEPTSPTAMD